MDQKIPWELLEDPTAFDLVDENGELFDAQGNLLKSWNC